MRLRDLGRLNAFRRRVALLKSSRSTSSFSRWQLLGFRDKVGASIGTTMQQRVSLPSLASRSSCLVAITVFALDIDGTEQLAQRQQSSLLEPVR